LAKPDAGAVALEFSPMSGIEVQAVVERLYRAPLLAARADLSFSVSP